ncbi:MAG TPA: acetyl-CoA hydrolase/transferase C-terminal domain-containing protein [Terriglobales bacterium]
MTSYTEVIQDGRIELLRSGELTCASATAFSLSPEIMEKVHAEMGNHCDRIVLRPQEISNHGEIIRRLGVIGMNGMIETDIYGNVNSTHVMGSRIQNGIGGSGDFARNGYQAIFMAPSTAQLGAITTIVPMVSHVDHTEHDVDVVVSEQGVADLRGLSPRQRAKVTIERCAHPDYRPLLRDYYGRAERLSLLPTSVDPTGMTAYHYAFTREDWFSAGNGKLAGNPNVKLGPVMQTESPIVRRPSNTLLFAADMAGTLLFGIEGALAAITGDLDLLGLMVLAFSRALAGGIFRDILIGAVPPSSLRDWRYSAMAGALVMLAGRKLKLSHTWSAVLGGVVCFVLRIVSVWRHWNLPKVLG